MSTKLSAELKLDPSSWLGQRKGKKDCILELVKTHPMQKSNLRSAPEFG
jgi:hypothetical protein